MCTLHAYFFLLIFLRERVKEVEYSDREKPVYVNIV